MPSHAPLMKAIQAHRKQLHSALGPNESVEFDQRCDELFQLVRDDPDKSEEVYYQLLAQIKKHRAAVAILSPEFPTLQDAQETTPSAPSEGATRLATLTEPQKTQVEVQNTERASFAETNMLPSHATAQASTPTGEQKQPSGPQNNKEGNSSSSSQKAWTPEQILQLFKEIVTAVIGLVLVGYTIYMLTIASGFIGNPNKLPDAKDLLQLLLGLTGVVLGYYFGRVPSDARATQAQQQADQANAKAEHISTRAEEISRSLDDLLTDPVITRGDAGMVQTIDKLRKLRNELRDLSSYSQNR